MKLSSLLGILVLVLTLGLSSTAVAGLPGDVTGNGSVDVSDIQCTVLTALNPQAPACLSSPTAADLNCSGATDVVDIQLEVLIVLYYPQPGLPADKDANKNNIVDACETAQPVCGNGKCEPPTESNANCPADCPASNYNPGDVIITEIMKDPKMIADLSGEWFEIRNMTGSTINLQGWIIADKGTDTHTINNGGTLNIESAKNLVLGINKDKATNGNVTVAYQYANFTLGNGADAVVLKAPDGTMIDTVAYDDAAFPDIPGRSLSLNTTAMEHLKNDVGTNWCAATMTMTSGDYGTPGTVNPNCPPPSVCGDSVVQPPEQCDPPAPSICDDQCQLANLAVCGNFLLEPGEECDDGNTKDGDGCSMFCLKETAVCGNGKVEPPEECDPPNPSAGCDASCKKLGVCGNKSVEPGEQCDDGNKIDGDGCSSTCMVETSDPLCGNGKVEGTEQCDDGCLKGIPNVCEFGVDDGDTCNYDCTDPGGQVGICGNGVVDPKNLEECDPPGMPNTKGEYCNQYCKFQDPQWCCNPSPCCCDGVKDAGEGCDDGNNKDGDGCSSKCVVESSTGISGTITYGGTGTANDFLMVIAYTAPVTDCKVPPSQPAGSTNKKGATFPFDYTLGIEKAGTYYVAATFDVGDNASVDSCKAYSGPVTVVANKVTTGVDIALPPATPAGTGSIEGKVSFAGQYTASDSITLTLSSTKPPQATPAGAPIKYKPIASLPYTYKFSNLSKGTYYVQALFDKGDDIQATGGPKAGDYFGAYLTTANPTGITVNDGQAVTGKDFTITDPIQ